MQSVTIQSDEVINTFLAAVQREKMSIYVKLEILKDYCFTFFLRNCRSLRLSW